MNKKLKSNIKLIGFVALIVAFAIGGAVVKLPSLSEQDVIALAYFGLGSALLYEIAKRIVK